MESRADKPGGNVILPQGITADEAVFLLRTFARLKEKRFGRLAVTVSDGRVVDVELTEKIDRNVLKTFST